MRHCEFGANDMYDCGSCDDFVQVLIRVARPLCVSHPICPVPDNRPVRTGLGDHGSLPAAVLLGRIRQKRLISS
jgi:hypothetical protein